MRSVMQLSCSALLLLAGKASAEQAASFPSLAATLKETGAQLEVRFACSCKGARMCGVRSLLPCACTGSVFAARRRLVRRLWQACA